MRALGADAIILSPLVPRSTDCNNPGTTDFTEIDPRYGTLEDFTSLVAKAKKLGKINLDLFYFLLIVLCSTVECLKHHRVCIRHSTG